MFLLTLVVTASLIIYIYIYRHIISLRNYWQEKNIPIAKGLLPFVGHAWKEFLVLESSVTVLEKIYNNHHGTSMVGIFNMSTPYLLIRDSELVKFVLSSGFNNFRHHESIPLDPNELVSLSPFLLNDEEWKQSRSVFINAFTSKKLKLMSVIIRKICDDLNQYLNDQLNQKQDFVEIEAKNLSARVTIKVATNTIMSVNEPSFDDKAPQIFKSLMDDIFPSSYINALRNNLARFIPMIGGSIVPEIINKHFRAVVEEFREIRKNDGIIRNDFFQHIIEQATKADTLSHVNGHTFSFFMDTYETSSLTLSFILVDLSIHRNFQEKLRQEVESIFDKYNNELSYDAINEMTYMDQFISESMRIRPGGGRLSKVCAEDTELVGSDGLKCKVKAGDQILISGQGIMNDPLYWKNPREFRPERFDKNSEEYKKRHKFVYFPFGEGPRQCPGMRMGLLQVKFALATIIKNYSIEKSPKLKEPIIRDPTSVMQPIKGGAWIRLRHIRNKMF